MRNSEKVKRNKWQPKFYYERLPVDLTDKKCIYQVGVMTNCIIRVGEVIVKGIAWCDPRDQFRRKTGRDKALGHAIQAIEHQKSVNPATKNMRVIIDPVREIPKFLSNWNIEPNDMERRLVEPHAAPAEQPQLDKTESSLL